MLIALPGTAQDYKEAIPTPSPNSHIDPRNIDLELLNKTIFSETNQIRRSFELDSLLPDDLLDSAASIHTRYLTTTSKLVHINSKTRELRTPGSRIASTGAEMSAVAENLARMSIFRLGKNGRFFVNDKGEPVDENGEPLVTFTYLELAQKLSQGWLNSDGHRENLLGPYTHLGVAARKMRTRDEILTELVFVQNFGKY